MAGEHVPPAAIAVPAAVAALVAASVAVLAASAPLAEGVFIVGWPFLVCVGLGCLGSAAIGGWLRLRAETSLAWRAWTTSLLLTALLLTGVIAVVVIAVWRIDGMPAALLNALFAAWRGPVLVSLAVLGLVAARRESAPIARWPTRLLWVIGGASGVLTVLFYGPDSALATTPPVIDAEWVHDPWMAVLGNALFQTCVATLLVTPIVLWMLVGRAPRASRPRLVVISASSSLGLVIAALAVVVVMPWQAGVDNATAASVVFAGMGLFATVLPAGIAAATLPLADETQRMTAARLLSSAAAVVFAVVLTGCVAALSIVYAPWLTPLGLGVVTVAFAAAGLGAVVAFVRLTDPGLESRPAAASAPSSSVLSRREAEVMELVAEGLTNTAIAERLFVSKRTVDAHLRSAFRKLGVADAPGTNPRVRAVSAWHNAADADRYAN